tara:strand:+ start:72 stop:311 length:240 start_codon:yes stop_codon:yes gene_type:complete
MGTLKPFETKCWIKFLQANGWSFSGRIKGSHHQYTKKGAIRSIPVWEAKKEIPGFHIQTGCRTIGTTTKIARQWAKDNC